MVMATLAVYEEFWREHYSWLKDCGYLLRPRYSPDWSPPWLHDKPKEPGEFEESISPQATTALDATRISDGSYVMLKRSDPSRWSDVHGVIPEVNLFQGLSSEPLGSNPKNRCIRPIEILRVPTDNSEEVIIVLPLLYPWDMVPFSTIGETVDFFSQVFEGLQFMHNNNIWHGDCKYSNIMMDASPILKDLPHPWCTTRVRDLSRQPRPARSRTEYPVKYYWINFDLSGVHDPSNGGHLPLVYPNYGSTRELPERALPNLQCNPFAVDVWCLGYMIRGYFTEGFIGRTAAEKFEGFEFMHELVADMCNACPAQRPTMDDVVNRFSDIRAGMSQWKLRSRVTRTYKRPSAIQAIRSVGHWARQLHFLATRRPAIPSA